MNKKDFDLVEKLGIDSLIEPLIFEWLKYKRAKGQSYKSADSLRLLTKNLMEYSGGDFSKAKKIIETSIANNWAGIFELKDNGKKENRHGQVSCIPGGKQGRSTL